MTKNIAASYQYDAAGTRGGTEHSQLPTVQGLVDFSMLDHLHSFLWIVNLHLNVLYTVSTTSSHHAYRGGSRARHTVMVFFSGRAVTSVDALRFPGFGASRTGISEGIVKDGMKALPPSKTFSWQLNWGLTDPSTIEGGGVGGGQVTRIGNIKRIVKGIGIETPVRYGGV